MEKMKTPRARIKNEDKNYLFAIDIFEFSHLL